MASAAQSFFQLLRTTGCLARTRLGWVVLAAVLPFVASHLVVMQARRLGLPERLVLDLLHGVIVLSYLTAVVRIVQGRAQGLAKFGLAWPRPRWPGLAAGARMTGAVVLIGLPLALALHPLVQAVEAWQTARSAGGLYFPVTMMPEFIMTTVVGLVLAARTAKMGPAKHTRDPMPIDVKICGINSPEALDAAVSGGAKMLGFVFFPASPRAVTPVEAQALMDRVPDGITKVALMVDPDDHDVGAVCRQLPIDLVQLHGSESVERVADIKAITGLPVMKAVGISSADDIKLAHTYEAVCERILLDAKAPEGATLPGGNALSFDWSLIRGETWEKPWMLAGGLNAENLKEAVETSGATFVDVSSGVEDAPGRKNPEKIRSFLTLAASL